MLKLETKHMLLDVCVYIECTQYVDVSLNNQVDQMNEQTVLNEMQPIPCL